MSKKNRVKRRASFARRRAEENRIYPYKIGTPEAELPLIDQLLLSHDIDQPIKDIMREATIIDGTSVSDYYWHGTDQEYWELKEDFPNIAPPFENFLFTFKAPDYSISEKYGKRKWAEEMPVEWAVLCQGADMTSALAGSLTHEQKTKLVQNAYKTYAHLTNEVRSVIDKFEAASEKEKAHFKDTLSEHELQQLDALKASHEIMTAHQENKLDELMQDMLTSTSARWILEAALFIKLLDETGKYYACLGPIMVAHYSADSEGKPMNGSYTLIGGWTKSVCEEIQRKQGHSQIEAGEMFRDTFNSFLLTALLSISFLHCKNISLTQETYRRKHNDDLARKIPRKVKETIPVSYHTLEITPMREVLKREGQSDTLGVKRALHICRGHFRHYENGRGLFGKYKGTYWIPQQVRGNLEHIALKDYSIKV